MSTLKEKAEAILQEKNTKIIPENFSENLEILGIQGDISTYESGSGNLQFTENVVDLPDNNQFIMEIENGSNVLYKEGSNMGLAALKSVVAQTIGLTANKIKKDEVILGVTGTYEGSGSATTVNTTIHNNLYPSYWDNSDLPDYMTIANLTNATFDLTKLKYWNTQKDTSQFWKTPISQYMGETPYVVFKMEVKSVYDVQGGFEIDWECRALSKQLEIYNDEYGSGYTLSAKNCYRASINAGVFTNTMWDDTTSEYVLDPNKNYQTFAEFWQDFHYSALENDDITYRKSDKTETYTLDNMDTYFVYTNN